MLNITRISTRVGAKVALSAAMITGSAVAAHAASVTQLDQAVNIFASGSVTGGAPFTVDVAEDTAITDGVELPGFAFGTYDVDVSADSITMTFVNDPSNLGISVYDVTTVDFYYYEFDQRLASASISALTEGFAASVELIAPGAMASSVGAFVDGLGTEFTFANGGFLVSIGEGTDLNQVGTGGSLTIDFAAVPLPAGLPLMLLGLGGLGALRARSRKSA